MARDLPDAVYGCLIGGAIGDALGAPVEGWHSEDVRREQGKVNQFKAQPARAERPGGGAPGTVTDDSVPGSFTPPTRRTRCWPSPPNTTASAGGSGR